MDLEIFMYEIRLDGTVPDSQQHLTNWRSDLVPRAGDIIQIAKTSSPEEDWSEWESWRVKEVVWTLCLYRGQSDARLRGITVYGEKCSNDLNLGIDQFLSSDFGV